MPRSWGSLPGLSAGCPVGGWLPIRVDRLPDHLGVWVSQACQQQRDADGTVRGERVPGLEQAPLGLGERKRLQ
ncbi:hypothetical protein Vqi01_58880 [Micromonospora qiuiae]|uniref:Transposase n=1 Tax=Micromonospora qiuiae TaxID=502268 RepID=A0ABQ4JJU5_9ACTN|nr:hypothetical protein Vqi01_58880 [Micromonospora qiuiae]